MMLNTQAMGTLKPAHVGSQWLSVLQHSRQSLQVVKEASNPGQAAPVCSSGVHLPCAAFSLVIGTIVVK